MGSLGLVTWDVPRGEYGKQLRFGRVVKVCVPLSSKPNIH